MKQFVLNWGPGEQVVFAIEEVLYSGATRWQHIDLVRVPGYGRVLFLDSQWQSSEADEFAYHEMLVQPVMFCHPAPRHVFIAGGGEGATAREVLRHWSVEKVTQLDIDAEVIAICRRYLPEWSAGAFDDPRLNLVIGDALAYLEQTDERYDVMVLDVPDLAPETPAAQLYSDDFYRLVRSRLAPGGMAALHVGPCQPSHFGLFLSIARSLHTAFDHLVLYPFPERRWIMGIGAGEPIVKTAFDPSRISGQLRYYTADLHTTLGILPGYIRQALDERGNL